MPEASLQKAPTPAPEPSKKIPWHPLKIEPRRLVITADKPTATFKVKNRSDYDVFVAVRVPVEMLTVKFGETIIPKSDSALRPIYVITVSPQETVEVHVKLMRFEMEALKTGELRDEDILVECGPADRANSVVPQDEKLIVTFSDKVISEEEREKEEKAKKEDEERWELEKTVKFEVHKRSDLWQRYALVNCNVQGICAKPTQIKSKAKLKAMKPPMESFRLPVRVDNEEKEKKTCVIM